MPISGQIGDMLPGRCYRRSPETSDLLGLRRADARNRTGDPFITSEVLYQLSYVGVCRDFLDFGRPLRRLVLQRCCKI